MNVDMCMCVLREGLKSFELPNGSLLLAVCDRDRLVANFGNAQIKNKWHVLNHPGNTEAQDRITNLDANHMFLLHIYCLDWEEWCLQNLEKKGGARMESSLKGELVSER